MAVNRFTEKAQEALLGAQERAQEAANPEIEGLHLLAALLADRDGVASSILRRARAKSGRTL
jgi:ATP-dependent Clp protease ATP-binding subunit ClpB